MKLSVIVAILFLVSIPTIVFGSNPAPYATEAIQNVFKVMEEFPKEEFDKEYKEEDGLQQLVAYFVKVYDMAGYSLADTINKIVDDMQNNPEAIPVEQEQSSYKQLSMLMLVIMYDCDPERGGCLDYFPPETHQSITWFMENNEFSKQRNNASH